MTPTATRPSNDADDWDRRLAELWAGIGGQAPEAFVERIERLAGERPAGDAAALFERGSAQDSTGHSDRAIPLYRAALAAGLDDTRRRRATIQLASSLRNVGEPNEAVALLSAECRAGDDPLNGAVRGFLALALADLGREREALSTSLAALAATLPRYAASLGRYADALLETTAATASASPAPSASGGSAGAPEDAASPGAAPSVDGDLGFRWRCRRGAVEVRRNGLLAATLRGDDAAAFVRDLEAADAAEGQQRMARLTGNYRRGNERTAADHPRNRRDRPERTRRRSG